jgi:small-conductance mechanosensitive channel
MATWGEAVLATWSSFSAQVEPVPVDLEDLVDDSLSSTDWIQAGAVVLASILLAIVANRVARRIGERTIGHGFASLLIARTLGYVIVVVGFIYALGSLGVRIGPLLGALGLVGLVLALALQGVVENFFGALILQSRRPFTIGDTVELGDHVGVVKDIDSRTVVMRGLDGTWIRVANSKVLKDPIVTLTTEPVRRSCLRVGVAYDTDLERAAAVIAGALDRVARICDDPPPLVVLREFATSSIDLDVYYWHASDVPAELVATNDVVLAIHQAFAEEDITIAFPQMVVWPGRSADDAPYPAPTDGEVYTEHPAVPGGRERSADRSSGGWRPWRRN